MLNATVNYFLFLKCNFRSLKRSQNKKGSINTILFLPERFWLYWPRFDPERDVAISEAVRYVSQRAKNIAENSRIVNVLDPKYTLCTRWNLPRKLWNTFEDIAL